MRKTISLLVAMSFLLTACGRPQTLNGTRYETYGLFNPQYRSDRVCYSVSVGNVIWGILLIETLIGPIYFFGFSLYNPIRLKHGPNDDCSVYG